MFQAFELLLTPFGEFVQNQSRMISKSNVVIEGLIILLLLDCGSCIPFESPMRENPLLRHATQQAYLERQRYSTEGTIEKKEYG